MTSTMIQSETANELSVRSSTVLHLHDFNHVQIGFRGLLIDGENGIDNGRCEFLCKRRVEFGSERGARDTEK